VSADFAVWRRENKTIRTEDRKDYKDVLKEPWNPLKPRRHTDTPKRRYRFFVVGVTQELMWTRTFLPHLQDNWCCSAFLGETEYTRDAHATVGKFPAWRGWHPFGCLVALA
jgi:hypothetical protein